MAPVNVYVDSSNNADHDVIIHGILITLGSKLVWMGAKRTFRQTKHSDLAEFVGVIEAIQCFLDVLPSLSSRNFPQVIFHNDNQSTISAISVERRHKSLTEFCNIVPGSAEVLKKLEAAQQSQFQVVFKQTSEKNSNGVQIADRLSRWPCKLGDDVNVKHTVNTRVGVLMQHLSRLGVRHDRPHLVSIVKELHILGHNTHKISSHNAWDRAQPYRHVDIITPGAALEHMIESRLTSNQ
jgi:hypothetical protein